MAATTLETPTRSSAPALAILLAISFSHLLNDMVQSLITAVYPILKNSLALSFAQLGLVTLTFQATASLLQPFVGMYTDKRPQPYSLLVGMACSGAGILLLSVAPSFPILLSAAALMGMGSSVFHPESSRVARLASGGQHGLAQSIFQVGGNAGSALGPLLAAFIVVPRGQRSIALFFLAIAVAMLVLSRVGAWYKAQTMRASKRVRSEAEPHTMPRRTIAISIAVLIALIFSKYFYLVSLSNYYTFYLMNKFHLGVRDAQIHLFLFLGAVAAGTVLGGPIGDRVGRKQVIWISILGVLPFSAALPHANLFWTRILTIIIGLVLASAFSAILVYAQELLPGRIGMVSGLFFGLAFGMAGIGAALLGILADHTSIRFVYQVCAWLPAMGFATALLPNLRSARVQVAT